VAIDGLLLKYFGPAAGIRATPADTCTTSRQASTLSTLEAFLAFAVGPTSPTRAVCIERIFLLPVSTRYPHGFLNSDVILLRCPACPSSPRAWRQVSHQEQLKGIIEERMALACRGEGQGQGQGERAGAEEATEAARPEQCSPAASPTDRQASARGSRTPGPQPVEEVGTGASTSDDSFSSHGVRLVDAWVCPGSESGSCVIAGRFATWVFRESRAGGPVFARGGAGGAGAAAAGVRGGGGHEGEGGQWIILK
jgi:hypothetical protein